MTDGDRVIKRVDVDINTLLINFIIVVIAGLVVLFLELFGQPTKRGFFCNDDSIKYPYQNNTISEASLVLAAVLIPYALIIVTVVWTIGCRTRTKVWRYEIPEWVTQSGSACGSYILGFGLCQVISSTGKFTIGRLRPHFLDVCKANIKCNEAQALGYIVDYECSGNPSEVIEGRMSFPSGHASVSFFAAIYVIMYLQNSSKWANYGFFRGAIQFLFILAAWWVSLTRIMDYWHHWSDVCAGALLGILSAYLTGTYLPGIVRNEIHRYEECIQLQSTSSPRSSSTIP